MFRRCQEDPGDICSVCCLAQECQNIGIKGASIAQELRALTAELPATFQAAAQQLQSSSIREACSHYAAFVATTLGSDSNTSQSAAELLLAIHCVRDAELGACREPAQQETSAHSEQTLENPARALGTDLADSASSAVQPAGHDAPAGTPLILLNHYDNMARWPLCNISFELHAHCMLHAKTEACNLQATWMVSTCARRLAGQEGHASGGTDEEISWDIDFSAAEGEDPVESTPADIDWDAGPAADGDAGVRKSEWDIELDADDTRPPAAPATEQGRLLTATNCAVVWLAFSHLDHSLALSSYQPAETLVQIHARGPSDLSDLSSLVAIEVEAHSQASGGSF